MKMVSSRIAQSAPKPSLSIFAPLCPRSNHFRIYYQETRSNFNRPLRHAFPVCLSASRAKSIFVPNSKTTHRQLSTSRALLKKGGKPVRDDKKLSSGLEVADDPYNFSELEADIDKATERLKSDLSKLRAGGRFNPDMVEGLKVLVPGSDRSLRLSDLAQCIPRGRQLHIIVGEKDHVKPISAAISTSGMSLTPQPDPSGANPLLIVINIPPPTAESRKAAVSEAAKAGEKASSVIRDARAKCQKKLRSMQVSKTARPDDLKKAGSQMEKTVERGNGAVKKIVDQAKKLLESG